MLNKQSCHNQHDDDDDDDDALINFLIKCFLSSSLNILLIYRP